jgi:hypothetical protein
MVRGSGRSFFATLFGPSTARTVVSYSGSQKPGTTSGGGMRAMLVPNGTAFSERSYVACGELPAENVHTLNVCCHVCHFGVLAFRFD